MLCPHFNNLLIKDAYVNIRRHQHHAFDIGRKAVMADRHNAGVLGSSAVDAKACVFDASGFLLVSLCLSGRWV